MPEWHRSGYNRLSSMSCISLGATDLPQADGLSKNRPAGRGPYNIFVAHQTDQL
jgi:hypothetical protein